MCFCACCVGLKVQWYAGITWYGHGSEILVRILLGYPNCTFWILSVVFSSQGAGDPTRLWNRLSLSEFRSVHILFIHTYVFTYTHYHTHSTKILWTPAGRIWWWTWSSLRPPLLSLQRLWVGGWMVLARGNSGQSTFKNRKTQNSNWLWNINLMLEIDLRPILSFRRKNIYVEWVFSRFAWCAYCHFNGGSAFQETSNRLWQLNSRMDVGQRFGLLVWSFIRSMWFLWTFVKCQTCKTCNFSQAGCRTTHLLKTEEALIEPRSPKIREELLPAVVKW